MVPLLPFIPYSTQTTLFIIELYLVAYTQTFVMSHSVADVIVGFERGIPVAPLFDDVSNISNAGNVDDQIAYMDPRVEQGRLYEDTNPFLPPIETDTETSFEQRFISSRNDDCSLPFDSAITQRWGVGGPFDHQVASRAYKLERDQALDRVQNGVIVDPNSTDDGLDHVRVGPPVEGTHESIGSLQNDANDPDTHRGDIIKTKRCIVARALKGVNVTFDPKTVVFAIAVGIWFFNSQ